ncbi:hypothetical protein NQZ68_038022 [Dissostichus eleginoides]|nr:hypothetical protein NQZ68_038022 [Dissostichus eleginoides]
MTLRIRDKRGLNGIIQPILMYCSACFFNMLTVTNQTKLTRIANTAARIIGLPTPNLTVQPSHASPPQ